MGGHVGEAVHLSGGAGVLGAEFHLQAVCEKGLPQYLPPSVHKDLLQN